MDDQTTIERLLAGNAGAVDQVRSWIQFAFGPYRGRLAADLEDLEQEILLELTASLRAGKFRARSSLRTFVRALVHHKCIDQLRARARRQWVDVDELDLPSSADSAFERLSRRQATDAALRVLERMPESCRELWGMLQQGMRYREMSQRLGITEGTLRARVHRCRQRALQLRKQLLSGGRVLKGRF